MADLSLEGAYRQWSDDLGRYANFLVGPSDAADVVADAVVAIVASGRWASVTEQKAYLFKAVLNAAQMRHRSSERRQLRERRATRLELDAEVEPTPDVGIREQLRDLSLQQRAVIHLTYWEDLRPADIAPILGISEGAVRKHLARARSHLRKTLTDDRT